MGLELDHLFLLCDAGAPEAEALIERGISEGTPNTHPGQGTANRRFFFRNAYLELLWIADSGEARTEAVRRTMLWERWSGRKTGACPVGIVLRQDGETEPLPFPTGTYKASYLPPTVSIEVAEDRALEQPAVFCLRSSEQSPSRRGPGPARHALPIEELTGVRLGYPGGNDPSQALRSLAARDLLEFDAAAELLLTLTFDRGKAQGEADLRPRLPLLLRW